MNKPHQFKIILLFISIFWCEMAVAEAIKPGKSTVIKQKGFTQSNILCKKNVNAGSELKDLDPNLFRIIKETAKENRISKEIILAIIKVESNFNPRALSVKGAKGLMQLMPDTSRRYGVVNAFDPEQNVRAGTAYIKEQIERFGSLRLGLAAYNAGPGAIEKYKSCPPYKETRKYIKKVLYYHSLYTKHDHNDGVISVLTASDNTTSKSAKKDQLHKKARLLRRTLILNPYDKTTCYKLASTYEQLGEDMQAIVILKNYLRYEKQRTERQKIRKNISRLRLSYSKTNGIKTVHFGQ